MFRNKKPARLTRGFERHFDGANRTTKESNCAIGIGCLPSVLTAMTEHICTAHKRRASKGTGRSAGPFLFAAQAAGLSVTNAALLETCQPTYAARFWFSSSRGVFGSAGN